jgi:hypothetical protein
VSAVGPGIGVPSQKRVRAAAVVLLAVVLCVGTGLATRQPAAGSPQLSRLSERFTFDSTDVNGDPAGGRTERVVEPKLRHIRAWISAVGAGAGLADLDGDGLANDLCLVDPRDDSVTIRPMTGQQGWAPFALSPAGLAYDPRTMAPMGCMPGDLNEDGYPDLLVSFWGRPPVAYLRRSGALTAGAFTAAEVAPDPGQIWNSTTANLVDLDGDGHLDLFIGNYFPTGARILDATAARDPATQMQDSMSKASNGGPSVILRSTGYTMVNGLRIPRWADASGALTRTQAHSWTLATGAQDLDGDGLPELYVANDFGPDYLLRNRSVPGRIAFAELRGARGPATPKSKVLGDDSFKSMGVAFTDLNRDSRPDFVVSNITTPYGLQESNFAFVSTGAGPLRGSVAPYRDDSEKLGMARTGWAWDIKAADFDGDGTDELVQAVGFVAGHTDRWAQLQELAMANDDVVRDPSAWPNFGPGTDIAGHQQDPFLVRHGDRFVDVAAGVGLANHGPTRGIAVGDVDHDGREDFVIANQWARSQFLHNTGPAGSYLGLRPLLPATGPAPAGRRPAVGAAVTVTRADGTILRRQLFPANGHTGVNAPELVFGLGRDTAPVAVEVTWRDGDGRHTLRRTMTPGWHDLLLQPTR